MADKEISPKLTRGGVIKKFMGGVGGVICCRGSYIPALGNNSPNSYSNYFITSLSISIFSLGTLITRNPFTSSISCYLHDAGNYIPVPRTMSGKKIT